MSRDDSFLNTGLSSAASRRLDAQTKQKTSERRSDRAHLLPGAEIILEWIAKEKKDTANLERMILNLESEDNVRAQLLARQMHLTFLDSLTNRAKNILRTIPKEDKSNGW